MSAAFMSAATMDDSSSSGGGNGTAPADGPGHMIYSGMCWRLHSMEALPLPGVGLANTLFGALAALSFCSIAHVVYTARRRARSAAASQQQQENNAGGEYSEAKSYRSRSSGLLASFASLGAFTNASSASEDDGSSAVSFSSYNKFLQVSCAWALLWVVFNLFPQWGSDRAMGTLLWHAAVASVVYTASLFLELAVVVFLLSGQVGQQAFRNAACICGVASVLYGSVVLYFRLEDIHVASANDSYPIAQLDFISTPHTLVFLAVSSMVLATFFLTTAAWGNPCGRRRDRSNALAARDGRQRSGTKQQRRRRSEGGAGQNADLEIPEHRSNSSPAAVVVSPTAPAPSRSYLGSSASSREWQEAASPLIKSVGVTPAASEHTVIVVSGAGGAEEQNRGYGGTSSSIVVGGSKRDKKLASASTDELELPDATVYGSAATSGESRSPSRSPSPSVVRVSPRSTTTGAARHAPKRRSVVAYSLFLALYYLIKSSGLLLLIFEHDAGICFLDGGILLYMLVYAFLLYWTLVQDSRYWHQLLSLVQVTQQEADEEDDASSRLLTESSAAGGRADAATSSSPRGGSAGGGGHHTRATSPSRQSRQYQRMLEGATSSSPSSRSALRENASILGIAQATAASAAAATAASASRSVGIGGSSGSSARAHLRSASVQLKDYVVAPNQLVRQRVVEIPEQVSASASHASSAASRSSAAVARVGRSKQRGRGGSPVLSRSGSGNGAAMLMGGVSAAAAAKLGSSPWSLAGVSSRVSSSLRVVAGGWSDRSCSLYLARWKGMHTVLLKQFTLPSITPEFFTLHFQDFIAQVPMGLWVGCAATQHEHLALALGISVDPPCVSLVIEWGANGTLYDALHPNRPAAAAAGAAGSVIPSALTPVYLPAASGGAGAAAGLEHSYTLPTSPGPRLVRAPSTGSGAGTVPTSPGMMGALSSNASFTSMQWGGGPSLLAQLCPLRLSLQIASAMAHLQRWSGYDAHPLHLSPASIMLDENLAAKIADFGDFYESASYSARDHSSRSSSSRRRVQHLSQAAWQSPEVLAGGAPTKASAVYSFGVVLWQLLTWRYPCVLVPREESALTGRAPSPSRSYSASASSDLGSSYPPMVVRRAVAQAAQRAPSILKSKRVSSTYVAPTTRDGLLAPPATFALSSSVGGGGDGGAPSHLSLSIGAAEHSGSHSPPSSPGSSAGPPTPTHLSDGDEEDNDGDDPSAAAPPPAIVYDCVRLSDLKLAQRYVLTENRRPPLPRMLPPLVARLLELCMDENPDDRPSFSIIVDYLQEECAELASLTLPLALPTDELEDPLHSPLGPLVQEQPHSSDAW